MAGSKTIDKSTAVIARARVESGEIEATATFEVTLERLFVALSTKEICAWWVRPGVFDTRDWNGDLREGGCWMASGVAGGQPYKLEGTFLTIEAPYRLVHTWHATGAPGASSQVSYDLAPQGYGVQLILRHTGIMNPDVLEKTRAGWVTSLERLRQLFASEHGSSS